jgi:hypothetical protein
VVTGTEHNINIVEISRNWQEQTNSNFLAMLANADNILQQGSTVNIYIWN